MYIIIMLGKEHPACFTQEKVNDSFFYNNQEFGVTKNWVGLFYSYFTYVENNAFFLAGINYLVASKNMDTDLVYSLKHIPYINFQYEENGDEMASIHIDLLLSKQNKNVKEQYGHSQLFGNDLLYKSVNSNAYSFVFEYPANIQILR